MRKSGSASPFRARPTGTFRHLLVLALSKPPARCARPVSRTCVRGIGDERCCAALSKSQAAMPLPIQHEETYASREPQVIDQPSLSEKRRHDDQRIPIGFLNRLERFRIHNFEVIDRGQRRCRDDLTGRGHYFRGRWLSLRHQLPAPLAEPVATPAPVRVRPRSGIGCENYMPAHLPRARSALR